MKSFLISCLLSIPLFTFSYHDVKMAMFNFMEIGEGIVLEIVFDKEDLLDKTLNIYSNDIFLEDKVIEYVTNNFNSNINNQLIQWEFCRVKSNGNTISITSNPILLTYKVETIIVNNTCLINTVKDHLNLINLSINNKKRSFRMDVDRISISAKYKQ